MRLLYFAIALLWAVLAVLLFAVIATVATDSMAMGEKTLAVGVLAVLILPVALQVRATHRQIREMTANRVVVGEEGIDLRLSGGAREWKGLQDVATTYLQWDEVHSISKERRRFVYPSVIPLGYPLDVFTLHCRERDFAFTRECIRNARQVAQEIAARIGGEV